MIPFILGGVALAVTGYGVKKYLEDESNCKELEDTVHTPTTFGQPAD